MSTKIELTRDFWKDHETPLDEIHLNAMTDKILDNSEKIKHLESDKGVMSVKAKDKGEPSSSYASGIKVDNTDTKNPKIEIDDTIIFVLDGGGALRLI